MSARDTSGSAPQHSHLHNNTMSRNENFWVDQVTVPQPPLGERQGVGNDKGGGGYFTPQHLGKVIRIQYLEDALIVSVDKRGFSSDRSTLASKLALAGWKVSPKSELTVQTPIAWLGKQTDGPRYSMTQAPTYLAKWSKSGYGLHAVLTRKSGHGGWWGKSYGLLTPPDYPSPTCKGPWLGLCGDSPVPLTAPESVKALCQALAPCCQPW